MLSPQAKKIMEQYFNLPFTGAEAVRCPYFNNVSTGRRGQLRVLAGKGTPREIVEESKIISLQYHLGIFDSTGHCCLHEQHGSQTTAEQIRKFLIGNRLGIDCSGFVTNILAAHYKETKKLNLARALNKNSKIFFRHAINHLRPIENIGVRTYFNDQNTTIVQSVAQIQPLDLIVMMEIDAQPKKYNHILLVTDVADNIIYYVHARAWPEEGLYEHGVAKGTITITNQNDTLLKQSWTEKNKTGAQNDTWLKAKKAASLQARRLNF